MHLLWLSLGTDPGLTLIKLSCEAQTLDHEYYRGYGVMGQLYYFNKHHFSRGLKREDQTACLFCFAKQAAERFHSAAWLLSHLYRALLDQCCCGKWVSNFSCMDSTPTSHCDTIEAADLWEKGCEMTQTTTCGLWNMLIQHIHWKRSNTIPHRSLKGGWLFS